MMKEEEIKHTVNVLTDILKDVPLGIGVRQQIKHAIIGLNELSQLKQNLKGIAYIKHPASSGGPECITCIACGNLLQVFGVTYPAQYKTGHKDDCWLHKALEG